MLGEGIELTKVIIRGQNIVVFQVENSKIKELELSIDCRGSSNVEMMDATGEVLIESLMYTVVIEPKSIATISILKLNAGYEVKTNFRYVIRDVAKEVQAALLLEYNELLKSKVERARNEWQDMPIDVMPVESIQKECRKKKCSFLDTEFPPSERSIFGPPGQKRITFDTEIQWRRPSEFMSALDGAGAEKPQIQVFDKTIEPADIKQGALGDCWFMSALASLAERPSLVDRLFITKHYSAEGIYRVKLCKNGEWVFVTLDDYFPCYVDGGPIFSRANGTELWVLLLEKAYAKLHGSYMALRSGFANEGMQDLTGCPTICYELENDLIQQSIQCGDFWKLMTYFDKEGFLLSASTPGQPPHHNDSRDASQLADDAGLIPGHAYSVIQCVDALGHQLLNVRNPWGEIEWQGDWSDNSPLWTQKMIDLVKPNLSDDNDGSFWMCFQDFIQRFQAVNVCRTKNYEEIRLKGKFLRVQDKNNQTN